MSQILAIIDELNADNGTNHKMDVLKSHAGNDLLKRVLKMAYDKCTYTYGISMKDIAYAENQHAPMLTLDEALDDLEDRFHTRTLTGNAARARLVELLENLSAGDATVLERVIKRDLRINMGRSNINKVFKGLIVKPVYMRCGTYNEKTAKKFDVEDAIVQLKADGTYREFNVQQGVGVTCISRSGEAYSYPEIEEILLGKGIDGVFFGELTVYRNGELLDRATGNGILRKDELPDDCLVVFDCWDVVTLEEYTGAIDKKKGKTPYANRWRAVRMMFPSHEAPPESRVRAIEGITVKSMAEALAYTAEVMNRGLEGTIIKERNAIFRDGTSLQQLKLKLEIAVEVRITGFHEGTPGTAREATFGAMTFATDDGEIQGRTSGFTNEQLEDFNSRREELIGQVMTVMCNDITRGRDSDHYALSHPRFVELRDDKDETDTLASAQAAKESAMMVEKAAA